MMTGGSQSDCDPGGRPTIWRLGREAYGGSVWYGLIGRRMGPGVGVMPHPERERKGGRRRVKTGARGHIGTI